MSDRIKKSSRRSAVFAAALIGLGGMGLMGSTAPAAAQNIIGYDPNAGAICSGPHGPAPCAVVLPWMSQNMPQAFVPQDGMIVAEIMQNCGGEPRCVAASWAAVEVQRCRNGFGVEGGCFGPNGEIMKVINRFVPQHLQPNVILRNMENDVRNGPGENNDLVGRNGWLRQRLGF
jgi:hypothetical protein